MPSLNRFEKLIRDAIALLVDRGEIKILRKKRRSLRPTTKQKKATHQCDQLAITRAGILYKSVTEKRKADDGIVSLLEAVSERFENDGEIEK